MVDRGGRLGPGPVAGVLIAFRFLLGFGVGGDYPVSAVLMSEYADHRNRGRMVGLVFSTQAVGLIIGPLIALALLGGGAGPGATWRILLGLGAIPAAAAVWLRRKMPEPPRFQAKAASPAQPSDPAADEAVGLRAFLASRRLLVLLAGTAGCWFLLDYAYYGNTISTPQIIALISPHASTDHDDRHPARHLRGRRGPRLHAGHRQDGPDRAPQAPAHRVHHDGRLLRRDRRWYPA